jgi:membrane protein YdbS with pleckstrin-like domain
MKKVNKKIIKYRAVQLLIIVLFVLLVAFLIAFIGFLSTETSFIEILMKVLLVMAIAIFFFVSAVIAIWAIFRYQEKIDDSK